MSTSTMPRLSMLETQILLILSTGDLHGYAIALEIQRRDPAGPKIYPTNLYRRLHALADRGLIDNAGTELDERGRARKRFTITETGRTTLESQTRHLEGFVEALRAAEGRGK
jgi:DNA-binding PadR family transcriptional regulator